MANYINFTLFTSRHLLCKSYSKEEDGTIYTKSHFDVNNATAEIISIEFSGLFAFLKARSYREAITSGVFNKNRYGTKVRCVHKHLKTPRTISRSQEDINHNHNEGNGLVILDIDMPETGAIIKSDDLYTLLCKIIPDFNQVACLAIGSSSSRIEGLDKAGYRVYFATQHPQSIPGFMEWLNKQLWLQGAGTIQLSKSGGLILRSIIDSAMASAHQLDFVGTPHVTDGIFLKEPFCKTYGQGTILFDCAKYTQLTKAEEQRYLNRVQNKKKSLRALSIKKEQAFDAQQRQLSLDPDRYDKESQPIIFKQGIAELQAVHLLHFQEKPPITVGELLKNMAEYDECSLADPVAGLDYPSGTRCAKFYANQHQGKEKPTIHSHAYYGVQYFLNSPPKNLYTEQDTLINIEAKKKLEVLIEQVFNRALDYKQGRLPNYVNNNASGIRNTVIKASLGLGKTTGVFDVARKLKAENKSIFIHLYVPNHKVANDIYNKQTNYEQQSGESKYALNIGIQKGRSQENCLKYDQVSKIKQGAILSAFCDNGEEQCEHIENCTYIQQFKQANNLDIIILAHSYLALHQNKFEKRKPDIVVIDEKFYPILIKSTAYLATDLKGILPSESLTGLEAAFKAKPQTGNAFKAVLSKYWHALEETVLLEESHCSEINKLLEFTQTYKSLKQTNTIKPSDSKTSVNQKQTILLGFSAKAYQLAEYLLDILRRRVGYHFLFNHISYLESDDAIYIHNVATFNFELKRAEINRLDSFIVNKVPILCLDATANKAISQCVLGSDIELDYIEVHAQRNLYVTQCHTKILSCLELNNPKKKVKQQAIDIINRTAKTNEAVYAGRTLVVTYLALHNDDEFMKALLPCIDVEHFGNIRGLDCYKNHHIILLGRLQPNSDAAILEAFSLFGHASREYQKGEHKNFTDKTDYSFENQAVNYLKIGQGKGRYFNNSSFHQVMDQMRESESIQAIARGRDIWSEKRKQVLILDSLALDVPVDRVVSWAELTPKNQQQRLINFFESHQGILIHSPRLLNKIKADISEAQWKDALSADTEYYTYPMGLYETRPPDNVQTEAYYQPSNIKVMTFYLKGKANQYKVTYDGKRQTEASTIQWIEQYCGKIKMF